MNTKKQAEKGRKFPICNKIPKDLKNARKRAENKPEILESVYVPILLSLIVIVLIFSFYIKFVK